ncbi:N-acetylglucosamine-6-phosphate deacetylase [Pseudalkalibacillus decolorationis]|uniref:N-acetylglucosamine-6-phosphate deacetylase n=1 Tax=Pseudalkalibacillus decolorationis TaxID=163879 RepID=UPI002148469B|nr:amidohydrolase family protein [Pseudalkalibacillus decolorationis]
MRTIEAIHYKTGELIEIDFQDGIFTKVDNKGASQDISLPYIAPGLIDLQINGYKGIDFNTLPIQESEILRLTRELWSVGVTSFFPTIITNSREKIEEAMVSIKNVCDKYPEIENSITGIHLEGPFISPEDGPRGAHDVQYVRSPDWSLFSRWQEAAGGKIKIVTLSPEWKGSEYFIRKCTNEGILISIGHTSAEPEQIIAAIEAGAKLSTHLGNGAHEMLRRHPNYLWEQLASEQLAATFICDGFHLPNSVIKTIIRMKGNRSIIVSDSVSLAGMEAGEYTNHIGGNVVLTKEGKLHIAENPNLLAGSAQSQLWGINYLLKNNLCKLAEAVDMATVNPAVHLNLTQLKSLEVNKQADFILFNYSSEFGIELISTYKTGNQVSNKHIGVKK